MVGSSSKSAVFGGSLPAVAACAQRLMVVSIPEQRDVAAVRPDVIHVGGGFRAQLMHRVRIGAQRALHQEQEAVSFPPRAVQPMPLSSLDTAGVRVFSLVLLAPSCLHAILPATRKSAETLWNCWHLAVRLQERRDVRWQQQRQLQVPPKEERLKPRNGNRPRKRELRAERSNINRAPRSPHQSRRSHPPRG